MNFKIGDSIVIPHKKSVEEIEFIEELEGITMIYTTNRCSYSSHQVRGVLEYVYETYNLKPKTRIK